MLNPFLDPTDADFDPTGTYEVPVFQDDMVLRAKQLNRHFDFLLRQDRASRHLLAGVGVATGLQPELSSSGPFTLSLSAGCGVTTDGDLLHLDARTYELCVPFEPQADYAPFAGLDTTEWLELVLERQPNKPHYSINDLVMRPYTQLRINDYVVVLYHEAQLQTADNCTGVGCDQAGAEYLRTLRVLLVPKTIIDDAPQLFVSSYQQAANAAAQLPTLVLRRLNPPTGGFYLDALKTQHLRLVTLANDFVQALTTAYDQISAVEDVPTLGGGAQLTDWMTTLTTKVGMYEQNLNQQYCYAWLKDLYEAYNEFRQATAQWLVATPGLATGFPQHLLLGEVFINGVGAPSVSRYAYRHTWLSAANGESTARRRALWLLRRLGYLIEGFQPPVDASVDQGGVLNGGVLNEGALEVLVPSEAKATLSVQTLKTGSTITNDLRTLDLTTTSPLRLTPDYHRTASFDRRSMPFYYTQNTTQDTRQYWSYAKAAAGRSREVLSYYRSDTDAPAHVNRPFDYQIEDFTFYRAEGLQGVAIGTALNHLTALRQTYNLAFDVVAVRHDAKQPSIVNDARQYVDLETAFAREQQLLRDMVTVNNAQHGVLGDSGGTSSRISIVGNIPIPEILRPLQYLSDSILTLAAVPNVQTLMGYCDPFEGQLSPEKLPDSIVTQLRVVKGIWAQYQDRVAELNALTAQLTLPTLLAQNPGLESGGGVPRGGTLVLVYSTQTKDAGTSSTAPSIVVADYYLPYRVASNTGAPVQFVVRDLPATTSGSGGNIGGSTGGSTSPISTTPSTPTIPQQPAPTPAPYAEITGVKVVEVDREQKLLTLDFQYRFKDGTKVHWNFGDGTPSETVSSIEEAKIGDYQEGVYRHVYDRNKYTKGMATVTIWLDDQVEPDSYEGYMVEVYDLYMAGL